MHSILPRKGASPPAFRWPDFFFLPLEASSNETEVVVDPEALPTEVLCDVNTEISPGRVKVSLYGYTWGQNWETDVAAAGQDYVFYRWRLCFQSRSWYINQKLSGEGAAIFEYV